MSEHVCGRDTHEASRWAVGVGSTAVHVLQVPAWLCEFVPGAQWLPTRAAGTPESAAGARQSVTVRGPCMPRGTSDAVSAAYVP